jgi:hypothetical protein
MPSKQATNAADALGADAMELVRLVEADLERHESAINEHQRTAWTIRGLYLTAGAALVAVSYTSFVALPDYFAFAATAVFVWADYFYSRLYTGVEQRILVLESLSATYRRLVSRSVRSKDSVDDFRGDLRAYSARPVAPDDRPQLWPIASLGPLKVFLLFYVALALFAAVSAFYIETNEKPGTTVKPSPTKIVVHRPWGQTPHRHPVP